MKFTIKTLILFLFIGIILGILLQYAHRNQYEILKPVVFQYDEDSSSWGIIMSVKKDVFKNIEKNWQKKHIHERK